MWGTRRRPRSGLVISRLADCFDLDRKRVAIAAFVVPDDDVRCNLYWRNMEIGGKEFRVELVYNPVRYPAGQQELPIAETGHES
jgi:hypothetical protein